MTIGGHLIYTVFLILSGGLLLMSLSHLYHAIRFGSRDPLAITTTGIFIAGLLAIVWTSLMLLHGVNWNRNFDVELPTVPSVHVTNSL